MSTEQNWATLAARLASFEVSIPIPVKKRSSNAKSQKTISWPHQNPSPVELARAGFFYKPSITSHDNTVCFMCDRALDGWEEEDDPATEHLKHAPSCGWAILLNASRNVDHVATMDDPTSATISEAREATFATGWPHEDKRGWTCKIQKMVEAGWHLAPTPDSDDFVSCAYCKLSLDGWEPKDKPFDEHFRRSPDCLFFVFAGNTAQKAAGKGKKARLSKASRLSTQSVVTTASEAPNIPDLDESIDTSTVSIQSTTSTTGNKKSARSRGKATRGKHNEPQSVAATGILPVDKNLLGGKVERPQGRKRKSDQISEHHRGERESTVKPEYPSKRPSTRGRQSEAQIVEPFNMQLSKDAHAESGSAKSSKEARKRASSRTRKISVASMASLRGGVPDNATIEAALEEDLDKSISNEDQSLPIVESDKQKQDRPNKGVNASIAPVRGKNSIEVPEDNVMASSADAVKDANKTEAEIITQPKGRKPRTTKKIGTKKTRKARGSVESSLTVETQAESSILAARTIDDDSGHETDASVANKSGIRKSSKRKVTGKGRSKKADTGLTNKHIEDVIQSQPKNQAVAGPPPPEAEALLAIADVLRDEERSIDEQIATLTQEIDEEEEDAPRKIAKKSKSAKSKAVKTKASKASAKAPHLSMPGAFSPLIEDSMEPSFSSVLSPNSPPVVSKYHQHESEMELDILPPATETTPTPKRSKTTTIPSGSPNRPNPTPALQRRLPGTMPTSQAQATVEMLITPSPPPSAQSSDVENAPPSSRPASQRPPLLAISPSTSQIRSIPLAPGTPTTTRLPLSPSKIGGGLQSSIPWSAVDVELIFNTAPGLNQDEENMNFWEIEDGDLTSPEKRMTVEDWISYHAKRAEEELKRDTERVVGVFESAGNQARTTLEGLHCF